MDAYTRFNSSNKRKRSRSPASKLPSSHTAQPERRGDFDGRQKRQDEQKRWNEIQEDERMREYVAQEDDFVLKQAKKKAAIRVKDGRAKPVDWLAILLRVIDPTRDLIDNDVQDEDLDFVDPEGIFDSLDGPSLSELEKDITTYLNLEKNRRNREYWRTMLTVCKDRRRILLSDDPGSRVVGSVSKDIDNLLRPKSYEELANLEKQIERKLSSDEPIDPDYWQQLLDSLLVWKAKAKLKLVYQEVLESKQAKMRTESAKAALEAKQELSGQIGPRVQLSIVDFPIDMDPEPQLQLSTKDRSLEMLDEKEFLRNVSDARQKVIRLGYIPAKRPQTSFASKNSPAAHSDWSSSTMSVAVPAASIDRNAQMAKSLYDREVARGVGEDEEVFAGEEEVETRNKDLWVGQHRPRKPKYFNRVQMGYEWNKYNQTHYDHDNPPPKVVQGYKFHIFYPDLIDKTKAPTYKILREGGRKKGQSSAPAGEDDTCIIRFDSGPPYETIAFRIIDRDWDYSAKHERGFKSRFENAILTLHFSFKKVFYRK